MSRILIIDDDEAVRASLERTLRASGHTVQAAASGEQGFGLARGGAFDVILSDVQMPGISGLDLLRKLRDARVDSTFIVMTGFGTIDTAIEAMRLGAVDFIQKPFFREELLNRIRSAAERRQLVRQVDLLQRRTRGEGGVGGMIGDSEAMRSVRELIARAGAAPGTVLITGETGTGKELAARAIHQASARASRTFVAVNCAALSESLLETELFGHARGAFTGAGAARAGLIEHASGGTLFLDEIGTMSKAVQAKLLRAVEAGEVRRVGENDSRQVDVRFVAATNVDLREAVESGEFRSDLYFRLNVHRVHLPPLRERQGDVRQLVAHFVARDGATAGIEGCTEPALEALASYGFPGNVRELEHLVQRAIATARPPHIDRDDLPGEVLAPAPLPPAAADGTVAAARERAEREMILAALSRSGGEIGSAARDLQVSRTTMWRLMKKHGISE
jgi:two-component system, NtrC family, response regulator HydG